jgi:hypothetical protein
MDPLADDVAAAFARLPAGHGQRMFTSALEDGIDAVPNAPDALRALFAQIDTVPLWVDWEELNRGGAATLRCGMLGIVVLLCYALPTAYASPDGNKPIALSGRLVDQAHRRIAETGSFVLETCRPDRLRRSGDGFKLTAKVRLMHAQVRQFLLHSGSWRTEAWGAPINQVDMAGTTLLLSLLVLDALRRLGMHFSSDEAHAVLQLWRYSGYLLGVEEELLCASEPEARRIAQLVCTPVRRPDEDSQTLVGALFDTSFETPLGQFRWLKWMYRGLARGLLGELLADQLDLPRSWYDPLLLPALRAIVRPAELMRRVVPGFNQLATTTGQQVWSNCVEYARC